MALPTTFPIGTAVQRSGYNNSAQQNNTPCLLWSRNDVVGVPTNVGIAHIVSSDAEDNPSGDGARLVLIGGIDDKFDAKREVITMNGTTEVLSLGQYCFVDSMIVLDAGSNGNNVGELTVTIDDGSMPLPVTATMFPSRGVNNGVSFAVPNPIPIDSRFKVPQNWHLLVIHVGLAGGMGSPVEPQWCRCSINFRNMATGLKLVGADFVVNAQGAHPGAGGPFAIPTQLTPGNLMHVNIEELSSDDIRIYGYFEAVMTPPDAVFYGAIDFLASHGYGLGATSQ